MEFRQINAGRGQLARQVSYGHSHVQWWRLRRGELIHGSRNQVDRKELTGITLAE